MSDAATVERKPRKTKFVPDVTRDLAREMEAAEVLLGSLRDIAAGDEDFLSDLVEGETGLFEIIDRIDASEIDDQSVVTGCEAAIAKLTDRKRKAEDRIRTKRTMLTVALEQIGLKSHRTTLGTYSISTVKPVAEVMDEADIPARFWTAGAPKLDKKALNEALTAREIAFREAESLPDEREREAAIQAAGLAHPEIAGAILSAPSVKLTIRR